VILTEIIEGIVEFVFPSLCYVCKTKLQEEEISVCSSCLANLELITPPYCVRCGKPSKDTVCNDCILMPHKFQRVRALGRYRGVLRELILGFKYKRKLKIGKLLGKMLGEILKKEEIIEGIDFIIPVPIYKVRLRDRGFNQSEILAQEVSKITSIPILTTNLVQVYPSVLQKELKGEKKEQLEKRKKNVARVFKVKDSTVLKHKKILLVDDIYTTGATLDACSHTLLTSGASLVVCSVVGRA
jgi:ComF family protein